MLVYIAVFLLLVVSIYFSIGKKVEEESPQKNPEEPKKMKQEVIDEKANNLQQESGVSFKKLKQQAKGKKKSKGGQNPEHPTYVNAIKNLHYTIVDCDYYYFDDGTVIMVIAQSESELKVVQIKDIQKDQEIVSSVLKLPPGIKVISATLGPLVVSDSSNFTMLLAIASFDHCAVNFYEIIMADTKIQFVKIGKEMSQIHKFPVKQIRLSKKQPNLMVSCGDASDLYVKLWNISHSTKEPFNQFQTNQIKHKYMVQGSGFDYYCVITKTSELKVHEIVFQQGSLKGIEKIMALTAHKKEALSASFDQSSKFVITTSKDKFAIIYQLDDYYKQSKIILQQEITSLEELSVSAITIASFSRSDDQVYVSFAHQSKVDIYCGTLGQTSMHEVKDFRLVTTIEDAQLGEIQQMHLYFDRNQEKVVLITLARNDNRMNIWNVTQQEKS